MTGIDWQHGDSVILQRTEVGKTLLLDALKAGYIKLQKRCDFNEVLQGQKVEQRLLQVEVFRKAMNQEVSSKDTKSACKKLNTFKLNEQLTKLQIISKESAVIEQAIRRNAFQPPLWRRIASRILHLFK